MNQHNTRALVESALLSVLGTILVLLGQYVPVIGMVALFLWPLPSALVVLRHGLRWGIMASVVTALSLTLFMNWITALGLWVLFGLTGLTFGYAVTKEFSPAVIITITSGAFLIGVFTAFLSVYVLSAITPMQIIDEWISAMQVSAGISEKLLGPNRAIDIYKEPEVLKTQILRMMPAGVLLSALLQSYINFEVLRRVLSRLGHVLEPLPPFSRWILPEYVAHLAVVAYLSLVLGMYYNIAIVEQISQNVFMTMSILLLIETSSVISYYLTQRRIPKLFSVLAVVLILTTPVLSMLAMLFGIIDILFDFRRLRYGWVDIL